MKKIKTTGKYSSPLIRKLLSEITPMEKIQTATKMIVAASLHDLVIAKGWSKIDFAQKINQNPSEISKWLSGTHNFTIDTLSEIATTLDINIAELFAYKQSKLEVKKELL